MANTETEGGPTKAKVLQNLQDEPGSTWRSTHASANRDRNQRPLGAFHYRWPLTGSTPCTTVRFPHLAITLHLLLGCFLIKSCRARDLNERAVGKKKPWQRTDVRPNASYNLTLFTVQTVHSGLLRTKLTGKSFHDRFPCSLFTLQTKHFAPSIKGVSRIMFLRLWSHFCGFPHCSGQHPVVFGIVRFLVKFCRIHMSKCLNVPCPWKTVKWLDGPKIKRISWWERDCAFIMPCNSQICCSWIDAKQVELHTETDKENVFICFTVTSPRK